MQAILPARPATERPKSVPHLPDHPDSWKHVRYSEGNIQLSFSKDACAPSVVPSSLVHSADVDIDLGRGLAHAKEWLENNVFRPGHKTNQALVYALLYAQGILPRYTLDPMPTTTRSVPTLTLRRVAPKRQLLLDESHLAGRPGPGRQSGRNHGRRPTRLCPSY